MAAKKKTGGRARGGAAKGKQVRGSLRVRKTVSARRIADTPARKQLRKDIQERVREGARLRAEIVRRIDEGLREAGLLRRRRR